MHFNCFDYVLWFAFPLLQAATLVILFRRGFHRLYPYFSSYMILQIGGVSFLFLAQHSPSLHVYGYWVIDVLNILISLAIFREIFDDAFGPSSDLRHFADILFTWSASMLLVGGCLWTIVNIYSGHNSIAAAILVADRSVRLMQCGLGIFVLMVAKHLGISRRHILYGIALGFGVFTSMNMLTAMAVSHPSLVQATSYWRFNLITCDLASLIWLGYTAVGITGRSAMLAMGVAVPRSIAATVKSALPDPVAGDTSAMLANNGMVAQNGGD